MAFGAVVAATLLTGCPDWKNAPGAAFTPAKPTEGRAIVYFYRPVVRTMSAYPIFMSIPESADNCFQMETGGYTALTAEPGKLRVAATYAGYVTLDLDVKAGETHYVRVDFDDDEKTRLSEISPNEGAQALAASRGINTCNDKVHRP